MSDLFKLLTGKSRTESQIDRFEKMKKKCKTKKELRKLEEELLHPEILPDYQGEKPKQDSIKEKSLKIVFPHKKFIDRLKEYTTINAYIENNIKARESGLFIALIKMLDKGILIYDPTTKKLEINNGKKRKIKRRTTKS